METLNEVLESSNSTMNVSVCGNGVNHAFELEDEAYVHVRLKSVTSIDAKAPNIVTKANTIAYKERARKSMVPIPVQKRSVGRRLSLIDFRRKSLRLDLEVCSHDSHTVNIEHLPEKELDWLEGDGFLERLETEDDIDTEILQQEVDTLRHDEPDTCRQHMLNILTSRLFGFLVLLVVLLDAVAIMTQIIIDIQANHISSEYFMKRDAHLLQILSDLKTPPFNSIKATDSEDMIYHLSMILNSTLSPTSRKKRSLDEHEDVVFLSRWRRAAEVVEDKKDYPGFSVDYKYLWSEYARLEKIYKYLHYFSLTLLSLLVIEVILKIIGFGKTFFHHKVEIFDSVIVISSFILDVVFMNDKERNIPVVTFLFIWQVVRVVSAMVFQNTKRVEFLLHMLGQITKKRKAEWKRY